jgi:nucleoside-diphosphate-sugar epimerase
MSPTKDALKPGIALGVVCGEEPARMNERVLVTGAAGYIGSVLVRTLLEDGFAVRGFDSLRFGGESLLGFYDHPRFEFRKGDVRNMSEMDAALDGVDAVVHLAAIVGDPACAREPDMAREINWEATVRLVDACRQRANVRRFVFASTCSNYGKMVGDGYVSEESALSPVSLYAELKVRCERYLLETALREDLVPTVLRFATLYGVSPRIRFDLTVNEFTREVALERELEIYGERFWRPYCHVEDVARACVLALESSPEKVSRRVFGVGATTENYQKQMLAEELLRIDPQARIRFVSVSEDPRDYRVDFSRIRDELGFETTRTVPEGMRRIYAAVREGVISDPDSARYRNT